MGRFYNNDDAPQSNFNEAGFQIQRLNDSWNKVKKLRLDADLMNWRWELEIIWSELATDAWVLNNDWAKNEWNLSVKGVDKLIALAVRHNNGKLLYDLLVLKEIFLRKLQNTSGKGSSYKENKDNRDF